MAYERKTIDTFEVQGYYAGSWEMVTVENTKKEAIVQRKIYDQNEPNPHRIKKVRVKK